MNSLQATATGLKQYGASLHSALNLIAFQQYRLSIGAISP